MIKRASVTVAVVALLLLPNQLVEAAPSSSPGREDSDVTRMVRDYIAAGVAGDTAALAAMYVEEMRSEDGIDESLAAEGKSLQGFGELYAVTYLDQDPGDRGPTHFYKVEFEEATCNFTVEINSTSGLLEGLVFAPLPSRKFDSPRLERLARELESGDGAALAQFWTEVEGRAPLVEEVTGDELVQDHVWVTYLWRSANETTERVLMGGGLEFGEQKLLTQLEGTDLWYWTEMMPRDSRYTYGFYVNVPTISRATLEERDLIGASMQLRLDRLNPESINGQSVIELPGAPSQPWSEKKPEVPAGTLVTESLTSEILGQERSITIYTPPGYDAGGERAGLLIVFDAGVYGASEGSSLVPTPTILDNLIHAGRIEPMVALLVHSTDRWSDLTCSETFIDFLALELVPWARDRFQVTQEAAHTIVAGSSLGGLTSTCAAFYHPETFGNVLSQSGAYWYAPDLEDTNGFFRGFPRADVNWAVSLYKSHAPLPIRFYMDVGSFEGTEQIETNRQLRDVLEAKGNEVAYREFHGGHDYLSWRGTLADGLLALADTQSTVHAGSLDSQASLDYLKGLEGQWVVEGGEEGQFGWEFDVTSRGTVVVERLKVGTPTEMTTTYYIDGGKLHAAHYCQLKNQPRLTAVGTEDEGDLHFVCNGHVGNTESHAELHMHGVHFQKKDDHLLIWMDMVENGEVAFQTSYELVRATSEN